MRKSEKGIHERVSWIARKSKKKKACDKGGSPRCCIKDSHQNVVKMETGGDRGEEMIQVEDQKERTGERCIRAQSLGVK
jgi:hypothetical protein